MKYFFLLRKKYNKFPEILYSCKDARDRYKMILKFVEENKIVSVCESKEFKVHEAGVGLHLVKTGDNEWVSKEIVNTGYLFDYYEFSKIDRINIVEFDVVNNVDDLDDMSIAMKELVLKIKKK